MRLNAAANDCMPGSRAHHQSADTTPEARAEIDVDVASEAVVDGQPKMLSVDLRRAVEPVEKPLAG